VRYLSLCSGIEAATVAWQGLGWEAVAFSEVEAFCCALLAHHYPDVPNLGDMTKIKGEGFRGTVDLIVGGTPCQSFSVAGLRGGMDDERGNLTFEYIRLLDEVRPRWFVWENVPGVLSIDSGRVFKRILDLMGQCGYGLAWAILDAQYFGIPQRRRRVFVVGHLGGWRRAAAVLFERESLQGHTPPSRKAGQAVAATVKSGTPSRRNGGSNAIPEEFIVAALTADGVGTCGADDNQAPAGHLVARSLNAHHGRIDGDSETFVAHPLTGEGFDGSEDGTGRGTPIVAFGCKDSVVAVGDEVAPTLRAMQHSDGNENAGGQLALAFTQNQVGDVLSGDVMPSMGANQNATGRNTPKIQSGMTVRRLTVRECERLMGLPDSWTLVPYRGKPAPDGPRYRALGNSFATPVVKWIGERIQLVEDAG